MAVEKGRNRRGNLVILFCLRQCFGRRVLSSVFSFRVLQPWVVRLSGERCCALAPGRAYVLKALCRAGNMSLLSLFSGRLLLFLLDLP
jgi:hypothetical protein